LCPHAEGSELESIQRILAEGLPVDLVAAAELG
jgi:hypothetical protein